VIWFGAARFLPAACEDCPWDIVPFHDVAAIVNLAAVGDRVLFVVTYEMHIFHTGQYTCTLHNICESRGKRGKARQDERVVRLASSHLSMGPTRSPHASPVDWLASSRTLHVRQKFASLATRRARPGESRVYSPRGHLCRQPLFSVSDSIL